jgi:hydrogenase maturation protein HypF
VSAGRGGVGGVSAGRGGRGGAPAARFLRVRGVVQGVGFRPFVYNLAVRLGVAGWVRNTSAGVEIQVEGDPAAVAAFCAALPREAPPRAYIAALDDEAVVGEGATAFVILESAADPAAYQLVSPDIATCDDCRAELLDPADRRHRYPFTNCTNCGPRFTIIEDLPYDRERTTMRAFPMCPACRREYTDPTDRRFHAEPNACPVCGPQVTLLDVRAGAGTAAVVLASGGHEPIARTAGLLCAGAIVAVKGLGGFHLACDATDGAAVRRLKERKRRPDKPLAVMFRDLGQVAAHCRTTPAERELLTSVEHPIVLVEWREVRSDLSPGPELAAGDLPGEGLSRAAAAPAGAAVGRGPSVDAAEISPEVAVRQRYLGVMLPYTPLHILLLEAAGRPLVMTSGNLAEEPIVRDVAELGRLAGIPDYHLVHDREIAARYDDSVAIVRRERPRLVRRSRGYAPFPVELPRELPQVLACGAELKNTFCLTRDRNAFLSQHIGDLENVETLEHFEASVALYEHLFRLSPEVVAYDLHPEYLATKYALARIAAGNASGAGPVPATPVAARGTGRATTGHPVEAVAVQHHHAHVAACLAEHGVEGPVIGVSMDGLGYGADGALWGGEVLLCDLLGSRRFAHLEYLPLAGGALAIRRPVRTAVGWLLALHGEAGVERARRAGFAVADDELAAVAAQVGAGVNAPLTSSCGRLFDAVAALGGVRDAVSYEGQAAIELEMVSAAGAAPYGFAVAAGAGEGGEPHVVRLAALFDGVLADLEAHATPAAVGSRLHATVSAIVVDLCRRARVVSGLAMVALSGGVFQNRLLTDLCEDALAAEGFTVLTHARLPANDGGLSLGQAVIAGYTVLSRRGLLDIPPDSLER